MCALLVCMQTRKLKALAKHLDVKPVDLEVLDINTVSVGNNREYLVLTNNQANELTSRSILDCVWAFRPEFLVAHTLPGIDVDTIKAVQLRYEDANAPLLALIPDKEHFVSDAIKADGRGAFLAQYDSEELELPGNLFAYRIN